MIKSPFLWAFLLHICMKDFFDELKEKILNYDPVYFVEKYLTIDNNRFRVSEFSWKPFADIYRYVGLKSIERQGKPLVIVASRQVGKTTMASVMECYFLASGLYGVEDRIPLRIIHLFPTIGLAQVYSKTKFQPMIQESVPIVLETEVTTNKKTKKIQNKIPFMVSKLDKSVEESLSFKQFNKNTLAIESTGANGDRIRGRTCDIIFFDEVQDMRVDAINNCTKILNQSKIGPPGSGVQVYFGTAKKKGSDFHKMWLNSNQQYYHLGCESCREYFPLYTPESNEWENIWITGYTVKCTHCGYEQDKRPAAGRGKWIASNTNEDKCMYVGYHINQLYMPNITKEDLLKQKPSFNPNVTERGYQNETLGEFYQGDTSPMDTEEIYHNCGDLDRAMRAGIKQGDEKMVIMGIDFGGKSDAEQLAYPDKSGKGKSYSTVVILSVKGPNLFDIELAIKLKKNTPEYKKQIIAELIRKYSVDLVVGDIGFSNDLSQMLHLEHGDKYIVSRAQGSIKAAGRARFVENMDVPEIQFERSYYIGEIFDLFKSGSIRFPLKNYDAIAWLIEHCCSMELKAAIPLVTGEPNITYIKGSTPNDGLMALLNAYLAYKYLITSAFKDTSQLSQKNNLEKNKKPLAILGYSSRRY